MKARKWIKIRFVIWVIRVLTKLAKTQSVQDTNSIELQGEQLIKDLEVEYNKGNKIFLTHSSLEGGNE